MYCRFHILMLIVELTVHTTAGVLCYQCTSELIHRCVTPAAFNDSYTFLSDCKEKECSVELAEFGDMNIPYKTDGRVIMKRGCLTDKCKNHEINCCTCNTDRCNSNEYCSTAYILSPSIVFVIGGFLLSLYCMLKRA